MKVTRELIDNKKKIVHVNYTKEEQEARVAAFAKKMEEIQKKNAPVSDAK